MIRTVIIGSGNVASALAFEIAAKGVLRSGDVQAGNLQVGDVSVGADESDSRSYADVQLVQIVARNWTKGVALAAKVGCDYTENFAEVESADLYIIALSDSAISEVSERIADLIESGKVPHDAVVAHTAGSVDMDRLSSLIKNRGVLYPLQTFSESRKVDFVHVPFFIEGQNAHTIEILSQVARSLSGCVHIASSLQRVALHLSAVFACNFVNHMYAESQRLVAASGFDASVLNPLIMETANKVAGQLNHTVNAENVQTGPAIRADRNTMERHLEMLSGEPKLQELYKTISQRIWEISKKI